MKLVLNILFYLGVAIFGFWVLLVLGGLIFRIEFVNDDHYLLLVQLRFYTIPAAILLTLAKTLKKKRKFVHNLLICLGTVVASGISVIILIFGLIISMCGWYTTEILYEKIDNPDVKIVAREFGCGAYDSSDPTHPTIYKERKITPYLNYYSKTDTLDIDISEWKKVDNIDNL